MLKKILLLIDSLGSGGAQRQMVGLAKLLQDRGYPIKIIYYHPICFYQAYLDEHHIPNEYVAGTENKIKRIFLIARAIRHFQPGIVISYLDAPNMMACLFKASGMKFKLIVSERNLSLTLNVSEKAKFFLFRYADVIVTNSYSQNRFIGKHYPHDQAKSITIPNYVDLETYTPSPPKKRGRVIIVVASVWKPKNTLGLIEAAKIIKGHGHTFVIKWYGIDEATPYVEECHNKITECGLENCFQLIPKTASIVQEYQNADYFCLPSFYEGTSNALCEALSCGLPAICSDVSDNGLYVKEKKNGFLFNPHVIPEIAEKIEKSLLLSDEEYKSYCKVSRRVAETYFSQKRFIEDYIALLPAK